MRKSTAAVCVAAAFTFGPAASAFAQDTTIPDQETTTSDDDDDDSDKTGLIGLAGLLGLAGLAGLKRRDDTTTRSSGATDVRR